MVDVTEDKNHIGICDNCIHRPYCFVAGKKKEYCGNYTEESGWEGRFERLKQTHPGLYGLLDVIENNGVTYKQAIDWINEHGNMNIRYWEVMQW